MYFPLTWNEYHINTWMIYSFPQILSTPIEKDNVGDHLESIRKGHEKMSIYNVSLINYLLLLYVAAI